MHSPISARNELASQVTFGVAVEIKDPNLINGRNKQVSADQKQSMGCPVQK